MANSDIVLHYDTCKNLALTQYRIRPENLSLLNTLKEKYKREINSPRRYEQISDLESLFNILEKRSALSLVDIHVLEEIYSILKINKGILENYKNLIEGKTSVTNRKRTTGEDIENREPPNNSSHRDSTSTHKFSDNFQSANPFENRNSNRQRLSERGRESSSRVNSSISENSPEPSGPHDGEYIFQVPFLTVFNDTLNRVCTGLFLFLVVTWKISHAGFQYIFECGKKSLNKLWSDSPVFFVGVCEMFYVFLEYLIASKPLWKTGFHFLIEVFKLVTNFISFISFVLRLTQTIVEKILNATHKDNNSPNIITIRNHSRSRRRHILNPRNSFTGWNQIPNYSNGNSSDSFKIVILLILLMFSLNLLPLSETEQDREVS